MAVPHRVTRRPALLTRQLSPIRACIHVRCSILTHANSGVWVHCECSSMPFITMLRDLWRNRASLARV